MFSFISELKKRLPEAHWSIVSSSLRLHKEIWNVLQEKKFGELALKKAGHDFSKWNPAFLGLLYINKNGEFQNEKILKNKSISDQLRFTALSLFEKTINQSENIGGEFGLEESFLLGLAINERFQLSKNQSTLLEDIARIPENNLALVLSCLMGILPNKELLLSLLIGESVIQQDMESALIAFFAQPLAEIDRLNILQSIGKSLSDQSWISVLKILATISPNVSSQLAKATLIRFKQSDSNSNNYKRLEQLKLESEALMLSGKNQEALAILSEAWDSGQRLQAELAAQLASSAEKSDDRIIALAALEQAAQLDPGNSIFENKILSGKIKKGMIDHQNLPSKTGNHPQPLLSAARVAAKNGHKDEARELLRAAWKSLKNTPNLQDNSNSQVFCKDLVSIMLDLKLIPIASEVAKYALALYPNSPALANSLTLVQIASKEFEAALQSAHLAVALFPDRKAYRKTLATILQTLGKYEEAINEWEFIFTDYKDSSEKELLSYSQCLFEVANFKECEISLNNLLKDYPDSALGHVLMGKLISQANKKGADNFFEKSIKLDPSNEDAWRELSFCKQKNGEIKEAIDILLDAKALFINSPSLLSQLAFLYKVANQSEKAINTLIEAKSFLDLSNQQEIDKNIFLDLGSLQIENDHLDAAIETFSEAYSLFPKNHKISWSYGKALLTKGHPGKALAPLKMAYKEEPNNQEMILDLCAAYIGAKKELHEAENILAEFLVHNPQNKIAKILEAECQLAVGNEEKALSKFSKLAKYSKATEDQFNQRIMIGLANAQIAKGDASKAITTLEALRNLHPENLEVLQNLCRVYALANKTQEAFQIANHLYLSADKKNEALVSWFARQAQDLGYVSEAREALETAIKNKPVKHNFQILLAELLWESNHVSEAKAILEKILISPLSRIEDLVSITENLKSHENMKMAARFMGKAIELSNQNDPELFRKLSDIYSHLDKKDKGLKAIEKAIALSPQNPKYLLSKVALLEDDHQTQSALESLEKAISILPKDANLLIRKAQLLNNDGNKLSALSAAEAALRLISQPKNDQIEFAIQLAMDSLNYDRARKIIANIKNATLGTICADVRSAFEMGQDIEAAQAITSISAEDFDSTQVRALVAQLEYSKGDLVSAKQVYKKALRQMGKSAASDNESKMNANTLFSVAIVGDLLQDWKSSIQILSKLINEYPDAASYKYALAHALLNQFEWGQICKASQIVNNAPKFEKDKKSILAEIIDLAQSVAGLASQADLKSEIDHLVIRARLRIDPENVTGNMPKLYPSDEKQAAALEFARGRIYLGEDTGNKALAFAKSGQVLIEMAIRNFSSDTHRAFAFSKQAIKKSPKNPAYLAMEAFSAAASENLSHAISSIEQALAILPNEARWHAFLGDCLINSGDSVAALPHLDLAVLLESSNQDHHFNLGLLQQESHNHKAAIASFNSSLKIDGEQIAPNIQLANSLLDQKELQLAASTIKNLFKLSGRNDDYLMLRSKLSASHSQFDKAIEFAQEAAEISPEREDIYGQWADLMVEKGNFKNALLLIAKAEKLAKNAVPWHIKAIRIKALYDKTASVSKNLENLFKGNQNDPQIAIALAEAQAEDGNIEAANATIQKALGNGKKLSIFEQAELHRFFAMTLKNNGQLDQAISELEKSAALAGHIVATHLEMGHVYLARRQRHSALQAFEKASAVDPSSPEPYLQLAQLFKNSKDYPKAEMALRQATEVAPQDSYIQRQLAAVMTLNLVHHAKSIGVPS